MTLDLEWLSSETGQQVIEIATSIGVDPNDIEKLRKKFPESEPALIGSAIHQAWLRKRAQLRWGQPTDFILTTDGLAQATRPEVSKLHAGIVTAHFGEKAHVVDLTCGLGFDALAFAAAGHHVTAVEFDPEIAKIAAINLRNHNVDVICADATSYSIPADATLIYVDPARRDPHGAKTSSGDTKRVSNPEQWSPKWSYVRSLAQNFPVMAKVAPGVDDETIGDWCAGFISVNGDLVEGLLTSFDTGRLAVVISDKSKKRFIGGHETRVAPFGEFLVVPDPALVRARALDVIADKIDGGLINEHISWLTASQENSVIELANESPRLAQVFHVQETLPFTPKLLRAELAKYKASAVTIMTRGVSVNVEELRKKIAPPLTKSAPELIVALYREDAGNRAIVARRV